MFRHCVRMEIREECYSCINRLVNYEKLLNFSCVCSITKYKILQCIERSGTDLFKRSKLMDKLQYWNIGKQIYTHTHIYIYTYIYII